MTSLRDRIAEAIIKADPCGYTNNRGEHVMCCDESMRDVEDTYKPDRVLWRERKDCGCARQVDTVLAELRKGLEWRGDSLYFHSKNIGNIYAIGGADEAGVTFLGNTKHDRRETEEAAREALMQAAIKWLEGE